MKNKIQYYAGLIIPHDLKDECTKLIEQLKNCEYKEAGYDKKKGTHETIISLRLNRDHRVLCIEYQPDPDKPDTYLVFYKAAWNHNYGQLNKLVVNLTIDESYEWIHFKQDPGFVAQPMHQHPLSFTDTGDYIELEFYDGELFLLDTTQQHAIQKQFPIIVNGSPGTGKTFIGLAVIERFIDTYDPLGPPLTILCLCPNDILAKKIETIWLKKRSKEAERHTIIFSSYDTWLQKETGLTLVGNDDLIKWLQDLPQNVAWNNQYSLEKPSVEELCQELRLMSGYSLGAYLDTVGSKKSKYTLDGKKWIYGLYLRYTDYCEQSNKCHPSFYQIVNPKPYDLVLFDEVQDMATRILVEVTKLAQKNRILFLIDTLQNLSDNTSIFEFLLSLVGIEHLVSLIGCYRNPPQIIALINKWLEVKLAFTGGLSSKLEPTFIQGVPVDDNEEDSSEHCSTWVDNDQEMESLIAKLKDLPLPQQWETAIITHETYLEEVRKKVPPDIVVYTAKQIKGQQYNTIIAYKMLEDPSLPLDGLLAKVDDLSTIVPLNPNAKDTTENLHPQPHLPKNLDNIDYFLYFCIGLVALSRTKQQLFFYQPSSHIKHYGLKQFVLRIKELWGFSAPAPLKLHVNETSYTAEELMQLRQKAQEKLDITGMNSSVTLSMPAEQKSQPEKTIEEKTPVIVEAKGKRKSTQPKAPVKIPPLTAKMLWENLAKKLPALFAEEPNCVIKILNEHVRVQNKAYPLCIVIDNNEQKNKAFCRYIIKHLKEIKKENIIALFFAIANCHNTLSVLLNSISMEDLEYLQSFIYEEMVLEEGFRPYSLCSSLSRGKTRGSVGLVLSLALRRRITHLDELSIDDLRKPIHTVSLFIWLLQLDKRVDWLSFTALVFPMIESFTSDDFFTCYLIDKTMQSHFSLLFDRAQDFLRLTLHKNNSIIKNATAAHIEGIKPEQFWSLLESDTDLLLSSPEVKNSLKKRVFSSKQFDKAQSNLYNLSQSQNGCRILCILLNEETSLIENLKPAYLTTQVPEKKDFPLYCFSRSKSGIAVLCLLVEKAPTLFKTINAEILCAIPLNETKSMLDWLQEEGKIGELLIQRLCKIQPELFFQIQDHVRKKHALTSFKLTDVITIIPKENDEAEPEQAKGWGSYCWS